MNGLVRMIPTEF